MTMQNMVVVSHTCICHW